MTQYNPIKGFTVIEKKTGAIKFAVYAANRLGNMRMAVDGIFYNDKEFNRFYDTRANNIMGEREDKVNNKMGN